jgi:hypothetical protein
MRLFFFGTLQDPDLFALVIGRPMTALATQPATLLGRQSRKVKGESYPILLPHPDGRVDGLLVDGFTPAEMDRMQFFESDDYALQPVTVTLADGSPVEAQIYASTGALEDAGEPWHLEAWQATEKPRTLMHHEAYMSLYGKMSSAEAALRWPEVKAQADRRYAEARAERHFAERRRPR